jgi:hypothetical protein
MGLPECMNAVERVLQSVVVTPDWQGNAQTTPFFQIVTVGPRESLPGTPSAWLENSTWNQPTELGSDREVTDWVIVARLFTQYVQDEDMAERVLMSCIEPIRAAFRRAIKMRDGSGNAIASVERALVKQGAWGYMDVNGVPMRYTDCTVMVREKQTVTYSA